MRYNISVGVNEACITPSAHSERRKRDINMGVRSQPEIQCINKPLSPVKQTYVNLCILSEHKPETCNWS